MAPFGAFKFAGAKVQKNIFLRNKLTFNLQKQRVSSYTLLSLQQII